MTYHSSHTKRRIFTALATMALAAMISTAAQAINVPAGLNPGDTYHLAFITSGVTSIRGQDITSLNNFVENQANSSSLTSGINWFAIGSYSTVDARDNTSTNPSSIGSPIFLANGITKIADDYPDLWDGSLDSPINRDQDNNPSGAADVWTGTGSDGRASSNPFFDDGSIVFATRGLTTPTDMRWVDNGAHVGNTGDAFPFYAISELLTVPEPANAAVPEPMTATLGLMGLGMLGMATRRRAA